MATINATLNVASPDLSSSALALTKTMTMTKAGTATGLTKTYVTATTQFDPFPVVKGTTNADENGRVYISNESEVASEYITVGIGDLVIGRLYAGDFMWMPWSPKAQHVNDIEITPSVATGMWVEFMAIHNFANIYPDSADS